MWSPDVHQYFDESLFYVLLRLGHARNVLDSVRALMREASIDHYSAYVVYGHFDALIRVWLTPHSWQALQSTINRGRQNGNRLLSLRATGVDYIWPDTDATTMSFDLNAELSSERIASIMKHEISISQYAREQTPALLGELIDDKLLLEKPEEPGAQIKLFLVLQAVEAGLDISDSREQIRRLVSDFRGERVSTLYSGAGDMGIHIIRATLKEYREVATFVHAVDRSLGTHPLRTMCLLVGGEEAIETDNVNNPFALTGTDRKLASLLGVSAGSLSNLSPIGRRRIDTVAHELWAELDDSPEWQTARSLLAAIVQNQPRVFRQHLSFLLDFEHYFKKYAESLATQRYGSEPLQMLEKRFPVVMRNVQRADDFESLTLGVVHGLLGAMAEDDSISNARLQSDLGEHWRSDVRRVLNLRNPFAHGNLAPDSADISSIDDEEWWAIADAILRALPMYKTLYTSSKKEYSP